MSKPVIFRVTNNLNLGGVQRRLHAVLPLLQKDFSVHVVTYRERGLLADELEAAGVTLHHVPCKGKWSPLGIWRIAQLLKKHNAAIVHGHSLGGNTLGIAAGLLAGTPVKIGQVHNRNLHWYGTTPWRKKKQCLQESWLHRFAHSHVLCVSEDSREYFLQQSGLPATQVSVLHNGINLDLFSPITAEEKKTRRLEYGLEPDALILGFVGRLTHEKGIDVLLNFAQQLYEQDARYSIVVVGSGSKSYVQKIQKEAATIGNGKSVIFLGERRDVHKIYPLFDAFLFTTVGDTEGMPGVVLEACAAELPILARRIDTVEEIKQYYPRIYFFDSNPNTITTIQEVLNSPLITTTAFRKEFSLQAMAERTTELYTRLLEQFNIKML